MSLEMLGEEQAVSARFGSADWSFTAGKQARGSEFHAYPARFIPQVPAQVLDLLGIRSGTVLDPFCGSGTTLAEARRRGLDAVGVDINPIACLISRVRASRWAPADESALMTHQAALLSAASESDGIGPEFVEIPRLDHWFSDHAQRALTGAVRYVRAIDPEDPWRDRVAVSVSAATVRISRQESDTRYAAVDKAGDQQSAAGAVARALGRTGQWLRTNTSDYEPDSQVNVYRRDARDLAPIPDASVSAVCFSPPYPNAYEYWLYHKYRMYWLGFDAVEVREQEIGARPHYCKPNGLDETDFAAQMTQVFGELERVTTSGAPVVVVVGDSVIGGRTVDNGSLLTSVAEASGFATEFAGKRPIATGRSSFNRAHSRGRKSEHVLLFRREA
ncbi:MAG: site-specific DNA-methyltransferase [Humibacillus sp.]|nr:site-specific DNA-methyltransferase [Humibacillus sp.]MDN5779052.1 site-specific DNA-methyltransferase [Humibacillus sp.]